MNKPYVMHALHLEKHAELAVKKKKNPSENKDLD